MWTKVGNKYSRPSEGYVLMGVRTTKDTFSKWGRAGVQRPQEGPGCLTEPAEKGVLDSRCHSQCLTWGEGVGYLV